ncbi:hypothetical protein MMC12_007006 [Toensbergia leucococca]|nr:hypothetical protein [Toensbergia leucococca]
MPSKFIQNVVSTVRKGLPWQKKNELSLTFGVEIEFYIKYFKEDVTPAMHSARPLEETEREDMKRRGIPRPLSCNKAIRHHISVLLRHAGIAVNQVDERGYDQWTVDKDCTIHSDADAQEPAVPLEDAVGVELISRKLPCCESSFEEIRRVLKIINGTFKTETNSSTGLHVHIGNQEKGFPLTCLKNLCQLVIVFQHQIESVHPDHRIDNVFCEGPSEMRSLHLREGPKRGISIIQGCERVWQIVEAMTPTRNAAYNLLDLTDSDDKRTIEFRQHAGTIDSEEILMWAEFLIGMIHFCKSVPSAEFTELITSQGLSSPDFGFLELLEVIGKQNLIDYYRPRLYQRNRK